MKHFVDIYSRRNRKILERIPPEIVSAFVFYSWPGNIRELQNVVERSIILCDTELFTVDESWLAPERGQSDIANRPSLRLKGEAEKAAIEAALARTGGRISGPDGAAAELGVPASTLESKIKTLRINKYRFKSA